ncbi:MAG: hypothetical protein EA365_15325 [Gloeocapsa sp. DLM2.Bin57]|nr:MAG: hypothetical protein EA365_15325 [Gloeocapsa sp. DLM2.Bin57]
MSILIKLLGIFLMFLGVYFLGQNIYFASSAYSFGFRGIKAGASILFLTSGVFMSFLLPKDSKIIGIIAIVIGIILVFWSGRVVLRPTTLWQFVLSMSSLTMGYKLLSSRVMRF